MVHIGQDPLDFLKAGEKQFNEETIAVKHRITKTYLKKIGMCKKILE